MRELQRQLKARGVQILKEADESTTGPASFVAVDPDGNQIIVDQRLNWMPPPCDSPRLGVEGTRVNCLGIVAGL